MSNITHNYGNYLRLEGLGNNSRRNYTSDLNFFLDWLRKKRIKLENISYEVISDYIDSLIKIELPEASVNRKISSLKSFLKFLNKTEEMDLTFIPKIHLIKSPTPSLISESQKSTTIISQKIDNASSNNQSGRRLLIALFFLNLFLACLFSFFILKMMNDNEVNNNTHADQSLYGLLLSAKIENVYKSGFDNVIIKTDLLSNDKVVYSGECKVGRDIDLNLDNSFKLILGKDCNMEPINENFVNKYKNLKLKMVINDQELLPHKDIVLTSLTSIEKAVSKSLQQKEQNGLVTINFTTIYGDIKPGDAVTKTFAENYSAKYIQSDQTVVGIAAEGSDLVPLSNSTCPAILSSFTDPLGEPVRCGLIPILIKN